MGKPADLHHGRAQITWATLWAPPGIYQAVEAVQQLRGTAGKNQVRDAAVAMTQNLGGMGAAAITHVLEAV